MGVTPHHGARESRVQGEAPESGGQRSRATNRRRIWGNAPGEADERRTDRSPPGVSLGTVKVVSQVLTGSMGKRACNGYRALCLPNKACSRKPHTSVVDLQWVAEPLWPASITCISLPTVEPVVIYSQYYFSLILPRSAPRKCLFARPFFQYSPTVLRSSTACCA